ncbi:MAG: cysteine desulfurase NifS [Phycisphaerales bacterium]
MEPVYLDHNSTTPVCPEARGAIERGLAELWQNPSSAHRAGQAVRHAIESARGSVARLIGVPARDLVFTSGATESLRLGAMGVLGARTDAARTQRRAIVTTPIEHEAVRDLCVWLLDRGEVDEVRELRITRQGLVDIDSLGSIDQTVALVCCMWANNETGVVQPIEAVGEAAHASGALCLCDATQWVGKVPTRVRTRRDPDGVPVDLLACSAHKMHGPKGVGALYIARGVPFRTPMPGTQERERRGGTENVPGILGFGAAAEAALSWLDDEHHRARIASMRDAFEQRVVELCPGASVNGAGAERLWNTTNIAFPRLEAEAILLRLSERGVYCSAGAACSSGSLEPSPVLLAMGVPEAQAHGSLRFSLSRETTEDELERAAGIVAEAVEKLRSVGA